MSPDKVDDELDQKIKIRRDACWFVGPLRVYELYLYIYSIYIYIYIYVYMHVYMYGWMDGWMDGCWNSLAQEPFISIRQSRLYRCRERDVIV